MKECPRCGSRDVYWYCDTCDKPISELKEDTEPSFIESLIRRFYRVKCPDCDRQSKLDSTVCSHCGTELTREHIQTRRFLPDNPGAALAGTIGFILGCGVGVVFYEAGAPYLVGLLLIDQLGGLQDTLGGIVFSRDAWIIFGGLVGGVNAWDLIKSA